MSDETYLKRLVVGLSLSFGWAAYGLFAAEYVPYPWLGGATVAAITAIVLETVRRRF